MVVYEKAAKCAVLRINTLFLNVLQRSLLQTFALRSISAPSQYFKDELRHLLPRDAKMLSRTFSCLASNQKENNVCLSVAQLAQAFYGKEVTLKHKLNNIFGKNQ